MTRPVPTVPCPTCGVPAGSWCESSPKRARTTEHVARLEIMRAQRKALEAEERAAEQRRAA